MGESGKRDQVLHSELVGDKRRQARVAVPDVLSKSHGGLTRHSCILREREGHGCITAHGQAAGESARDEGALQMPWRDFRSRDLKDVLLANLQPPTASSRCADAP